jgi:pentatricopeptide repeat protein
VPQHLPSYAGMARCHAQLGEHQKAVELFDQVIAIDPKVCSLCVCVF